MTEAEQLIQTAQKEVLESYKKEFDQLLVSFRDLDGKAQGAATTSGAFLAATLAYLNRPGVLNSPIASILVLLAVLGLMFGVAFSLMALRIRQVPGPPSGEDVEEILRVLGSAESQEELAARLIYFYGDEAQLWKDCVQRRREINNDKAYHIWSAQRSLIITAVSVIGLIGLIIVDS